MGLPGVSLSQPDVSPEPPQSSAAAVPGVGEVLWDDGLMGQPRHWTLVPSQTPVSYSRLQLPLPTHRDTVKVIILLNKIRRETTVLNGEGVYAYQFDTKWFVVAILIGENPNPTKI